MPAWNTANMSLISEENRDGGGFGETVGIDEKHPGRKEATVAGCYNPDQCRASMLTAEAFKNIG